MYKAWSDSTVIESHYVSDTEFEVTSKLTSDFGRKREISSKWETAKSNLLYYQTPEWREERGKAYAKQVRLCIRGHKRLTSDFFFNLGWQHNWNQLKRGSPPQPKIPIGYNRNGTEISDRKVESDRNCLSDFISDQIFDLLSDRILFPIEIPVGFSSTFRSDPIFFFFN